MRPRKPTLALAAFFAADGFGLANWAARIPAVKHAHELSNARLGFVLFAIAAGALAAMPLAGAVAARAGTVRTLLGASALDLVALAVLTQPPGFVPLLATGALMGAGFGAMNVALNAHGVATEAVVGRPILARLHAAFSAGALGGAAVGGLVAWAGVSPRVHLPIAAALTGVVLALIAPRLVLPGPAPPPTSQLFAWPHGRLFWLGTIAFCSMLAEGAAADWSATFLHDSVGASVGLAAGGYFAFSATMTLGRLFGDRLAARFGPRALVRTGCVCAALGLGGSLVAQTTVAGFAGFALLGAGVATIIPITFRTAAATIPTAPAAAVASVSTLAWLGFLIGPPVIGQIAAATTLPWALVLVVVALLAIVLLAGVLNPRSTAAAAAEARGHPAPAR